MCGLDYKVNELHCFVLCVLYINILEYIKREQVGTYK